MWESRSIVNLDAGMQTMLLHLNTTKTLKVKEQLVFLQKVALGCFAVIQMRITTFHQGIENNGILSRKKQLIL